MPDKPQDDTPQVGTTKPRKLTTKQLKFVKAKAEGKTGVEAAQIAYGVLDYNTANVMAVENLQKPTIQQALEAEFEKQGITLNAIVKPIKDGLTASKTVIIRDKGATGEDADNSAFADEVPDHAIRLKASGMAAQLIGIGKNTGEGNTNFNFINVSRGDKSDYGL